MSLFSIVKDVMDSNGWPQPTTAVASAQDQNMRQSFSLANKSLKAASFKKNWPVLIREYTFPTVGGTVDYALPADFHHLVTPSAVNTSQYYAMRGSLTPLQWYRKVLQNAVDWGDSFRIDLAGRKFKVAPTPAGGNSMTFMYITDNIAKSAAGDPLKQYAQDTDYSLIDEDIVQMGLEWRWRQKKGLDYTAEMAEYQGTMNQRYAQQLSYGEFPIGGKFNDDMYPLTSGAPIYGPIGV